MTDLGALAWPDVAARARETVLAIPLGSTEQHGPHLPLSTDTDVAVALARRLTVLRPDVVVAPAVPYGSSGEHAGFPGTLSIGQAALELMLVELIRSADVFAGALIISAHGGNAEPVGRAVDLLAREGRPVRVWSPPAVDPTDTHAGHTETSVLLALHPEAVRAGRAERGSRQAIGELWPALRQGGVAAVSPNGVLGDPTDASVEAGQRLLTAWTEALYRAIDGWP
jgi:mycofactocin system creatininase family protein